MNKYKLGDCCYKISKGATPKHFDNIKTQISSNIKFLRVTDMKSFYLRDCEFYIDEKDIEKQGLKIIPQNSVVLSIEGTIGKAGVLKDDFLMNQAVAYFLPNESIIDPYFLGYFLEFYFLHSNLDVGTTRKALRLGALSDIEINLPDLPTQKKIANLLSSLDDKIEINNRINQELEELGQALYTKWFINFDFPNEEGKPYKSSGGEMVESELGMIPKGWKVDNLHSITIKNKKAFKDKSEWRNLSLMDLSNMPSRNSCLSSWDNGFKMNTNGYELNEYDILFGSIRPYLKKAGFSPIKGVVAGTVHSFSPIEDVYYSYILNTVITDNMFEYAMSRSTGTKMPTISYDNLMNYPISIPKNKDIMRDFNKMTYPFIEQMKFNILENKKLEELRDFLIPQLMSGNLEIKDLEDIEKKL